MKSLLTVRLESVKEQRVSAEQDIKDLHNQVAEAVAEDNKLVLEVCV